MITPLAAAPYPHKYYFSETSIRPPLPLENKIREKKKRGEEKRNNYRSEQLARKHDPCSPGGARDAVAKPISTVRAWATGDR
jgi:hypothetical protein